MGTQNKYRPVVCRIGIKLILLLVFLGVHSGCAFFSLSLGSRISPLEETVVSGEGDDKVLVIAIKGLISNKKSKTIFGNVMEVGMVERIRETLKKADADHHIKAILLKINSPGGTVTSSDIIYHQLKSFKNKKGIRVYAIFMDLAASGGYYVAQAADKIFAHPTSVTGSIGVISLKMNLKNLLDKVGVEFEVVKSGEKKDFLSPFRPFTVEERELFQETIDSMHQRFVDTVLENRPGISRASMKSLADGRIFTSQQALDFKLIDHIAYLDEAEELIKQDMAVQKLKFVVYSRPGQYKNNLYSALPYSPTINLLNVDLNFLPLNLESKFLYLWIP